MSKTGLVPNCDVSITSGNSSEAQQQRFLERIECGPVTLQARSLGIIHPGMRICEIRRQGHDIVTESAVEYCPGRVLHRIARYVMRQAGEVDE